MTNQHIKHMRKLNQPVRLVTFIVISLLFACEQPVDGTQMLAFERTYVLGLGDDQAIQEKKSNKLIDEYGNYIKFYHDLLSSKVSLEELFMNDQLKTDLGAYLLNNCIEDKRDIAIELGKKLIDEGVNPFSADYFGVTPVVYSVFLKERNIFEYIIQKDKILKYTKQDTEFLLNLHEYAKYRGIF